jgi:lysine-N-methylase
MGRSLPILLSSASGQRYSCHGCGNCCRDFTVQLRESDLEKLRGQRWEERLGEPVIVEFRGRTFLRQRDDGACIFWQEDGRCRIHAEHGLDAKPIACQLFPFSLAPASDGVHVGVSFACQSVQENRGAPLESHRAALRRMLAEVPEAGREAHWPLLSGELEADATECAAFERALDGLLRGAGGALSLTRRLEGLAWLVQMLSAATFQKVRGVRCEELLSTLMQVLPLELDAAPPEPVGRGAWKMLRQAVFARVEDVKIRDAQRQGVLRGALGQLMRSRRFSAGRGAMPLDILGWPKGVRFSAILQVGTAREAEDAAAIEDLLIRWARSSVLGARAWGTGYYGWSIVDGTAALLLNLLCALWLARAHAAGCHRTALTIADVRAAVGRVDRHAGRAPWLGSGGERLRIRYLHTVEAWRGLVVALTPVESAAPSS